MIHQPSKIAILVATYNGEKYITEQLQSIANQDYRQITCYIHDDGSSDSTKEKITEFCKTDDRFKSVSGPRCGSAKENFFYLMKQIKDEEYIMFCDQDDYWEPNKVSVSLGIMKDTEKEAKIVCVYSDLEVVDEQKKVICPSFYKYTGKNPRKNDFTSLIMNNVVVGCSMMINRILADKALEEVDHQHIFMHDWWIALIASACGKIVYIDQPLIKYRQHHDNNVGAIKKENAIVKTWKLITFQNYKHNQERIQRSINYAKALDIAIDETKYKELIHGIAEAKNHCWAYRAVFFVKNGLIPINRIGKVLWL